MAPSSSSLNSISSSKVTQWAIPLLLVIVLLGAGLRLYKLDEKSLWSDEIATIASARGNSIDPNAYVVEGKSFDPPLPVPAGKYLEQATHCHGLLNISTIVEVLRYNIHPPVFFVLMNSVLHYLGLGVVGLRMPAVLFGILAIPLMYAVAREVTSRPIALLAASLMAFSGYQVSHSQDARQYTLLIDLALLASFCALRLKNTQFKAIGFKTPLYWLGLWFACATLFLTQYLSVTFIGMILLWVLLQGWKNRLAMTGWLMVATFVGLEILLWYPYMSEQMDFYQQVGHFTQGLWNPVELPEKLWRILSEFISPKSTVVKILATVGLIGSGIVGIMGHSKDNQAGFIKRFIPQHPALQFALFWLVGVVVAQLGLDLIRDTHTVAIRRYLLLASPALYLLLAQALGGLVFQSAGEALQSRRQWVKSALIGVLLFLILLSTGQTLAYKHTSSDEFKQAAAYIQRFYQPGDLVLVNKSGAMAVGMAYYLPSETMMLGLSSVKSSNDVTPENQQLLSLANHLKRCQQQCPNRIWMTFSHESPSAKVALLNWLKQQGYHQQDRHEVPGVEVLQFQKRA